LKSNWSTEHILQLTDTLDRVSSVHSQGDADARDIDIHSI
jgi:hypothetical protein